MTSVPTVWFKFAIYWRFDLECYPPPLDLNFTKSQKMFKFWNLTLFDLFWYFWPPVSKNDSRVDLIWPLFRFLILSDLTWPRKWLLKNWCYKLCFELKHDQFLHWSIFDLKWPPMAPGDLAKVNIFLKFVLINISKHYGP